MKKLIEYSDGYRWHRGAESSGEFEKDSDTYNEKLAEGFELVLLSQADKDAYEAEQVITQANLTMTSIASDIPQIEKDTWPTQEREALAWSGDNTASVPFITELAAARGIELSVLVPKILIKSDIYRSALASALGAKHKLEDNI